jgi:hypothetical protein
MRIKFGPDFKEGMQCNHRRPFTQRQEIVGLEFGRLPRTRMSISAFGSLLTRLSV